MPKTAKKGGGKGGGKTEEERLMFLQQRAQAEEETARKKEEILTLFLEDKLQKEERNTAVNLLKLNDGWRSILRQTRAGELRGAVEVLLQTFERQLDGLDSVVKTLDADLQEAERQSAQVRRIHLQQVERLWAGQLKRMALVQQRWEGGLQHLISGFSFDRKQSLSHCVQQRADLEDATFTVEQRQRAVMTEIHRMYSEGIAAYQSSHEERKAALIQKDGSKLDDVVVLNQNAAEAYSVEAYQLTDLLLETQHLIRMTDRDVKHARKMQDTVIFLREELNAHITDNQSAEQDLTDARKQVDRRTRAIRGQLIQDHAAARTLLTELTIQSDNAAKKLKAVIAKGQKVLRAAEMCRKLESEQKDVLLIFPPEEQRQETTGPETEGQDKEMSALQQLTRRINTSVLQREALRRRRDDLNRDNRQLRLLLRQHLDAMTVSDQDLGGCHALLTVQRAPTTAAPTAAAPPLAGRRHTVIEAVHAVKHSL
ncbi:dynein regulatory complex subunit 2 [Anoplopoma fimbria]|uniref:dynein regulatory complex subunit 2 n=1 Tax=Anoplopoma fimbria TaxID=229290 RepID=UPI0023ECF39D|nr:dynein regulatory complex subunit 2 [Anoplopoma fimbria]